MTSEPSTPGPASENSQPSRGRVPTGLFSNRWGAPPTWWRIVQWGVIFGAIAANEHWKWIEDDGGYTATILGLGAAVFATALVNAGYDVYQSSRHAKMWKLFQFAVIVGVFASNIQWHWVDGHFAAAVVGLFAAALSTLIIKSLLKLFRLLLEQATRRAQ